jgi:hypothetical protein
MKRLESSIRLRCTAEESQQAHELADADGTTVSDFLRTLIRQLHAERFASAKRTPKRKPRT